MLQVWLLVCLSSHEAALDILLHLNVLVHLLHGKERLVNDHLVMWYMHTLAVLQLWVWHRICCTLLILLNISQ